MQLPLRTRGGFVKLATPGNKADDQEALITVEKLTPFCLVLFCAIRQGFFFFFFFPAADAV